LLSWTRRRRAKSWKFGEQSFCCFAESIETIGGKALPGLPAAARPADHHPVRLSQAPKPKRQAQIALGTVAGAAVYFLHLRPTSGGDLDTRPDAAAVATRSRQLKLDPVRAREDCVAKQAGPVVGVVDQE